MDVNEPSIRARRSELKEMAGYFDGAGGEFDPAAVVVEESVVEVAGDVVVDVIEGDVAEAAAAEEAVAAAWKRRMVR
jgi:hypothetical protein